MGLGPPSCYKCKVWLIHSNTQGWTCPLCGIDAGNQNGYSHLNQGYMNERHMDEWTKIVVKIVVGRKKNKHWI